MCRDWYYSIEYADEFTEGHIWATEEQVRKTVDIMRSLLPGATISFCDGGEYLYICDDDTDVDDLARAVIREAGFVTYEDVVDEIVALRM
jgi:hypothetical protein